MIEDEKRKKKWKKRQVLVLKEQTEESPALTELVKVLRS
jgi:hypothetical protein